MSSSTKILIPLYVTPQRFSLVISRLLGVDMKEVVFGETKHVGRGKEPMTVYPDFDPSRPSCKENPWYLELSSKDRALSSGHITPSGNDMTTGHFSFCDGTGSAHSWFYLFHDENESYQLLMPGSTALAVAVGKRLVRFFGGECFFNGNLDDDDKRNFFKVNPRRAQFPTRKPDQSSDDRWYQFYNALQAVTMLTTKELTAAAELSSYGIVDREKKFSDFLESKRLEMNIEKATQEMSTVSPSLSRPRL